MENDLKKNKAEKIVSSGLMPEQLRSWISAMTEREENKTPAEITALIKEIETCANFPTEVSTLCHWCAYKPMCPAWKHEAELEEKTPQQFKDDDGVKLVDELSRLDEKKKEASRA